MPTRGRAAASPPAQPDADRRAVPDERDPHRRRGDRAEILARYLDRQRFRLHVASLCRSTSRRSWRGCAPKASRSTRAATRWRDDDKVAQLRALIRSRRIRVVVACQDTRLAYRVFEGLSPAECGLIEHGGIVEEVSAIPKDRTALYVGVSKAICAGRGTAMRDPRPTPCACRAWSTPSVYAGLDRARLRAAFGFASDACIVTFVGRLDPKKRLEDLLEAARRCCPETRRSACSSSAAPTRFSPTTRSRFSSATHGDWPMFTFAGAAGDVPGILTASDILVLPAVGEGMSHVINEAGAAGLAVVAADDGAARGAARRRRGRPPGAAGPAGSHGAVPGRARRGRRDARGRSAQRLRDRVCSGTTAPASLVPKWQRLLSTTAAAAGSSRTRR